MFTKVRFADPEGRFGLKGLVIPAGMVRRMSEPELRAIFELRPVPVGAYKLVPEKSPEFQSWMDAHEYQFPSDQEPS